jgi:uncharacterized protein YpmS
LSKKQANQLISDALKKYQTKKISYNFYLENLAVLTGTFNLLGKDLDFTAYFTPTALKNGDVELTVKRISVGTLSLPNSLVLSGVQAYDLPKYVEVQPKKDKITIHLNDLKLAKSYIAQAKKIALNEDVIQFELVKAE